MFILYVYCTIGIVQRYKKMILPNLLLLFFVKRGIFLNYEGLYNEHLAQERRE